MNSHLNPNSGRLNSDDQDADRALRPKGIEEFKGQPQAIQNLEVFINAARKRGEALDHVLLHGPPGLS